MARSAQGVDPSTTSTAVVRGLQVRFRSRRRDLLVLDGFDLDIRGGELVALLGPSGCGKTTLLRILAGLLKPVAGFVQVDGSEPEQARRRGEVALVTQKPTLLPHRTVEQNVRLPLQLARIRDEDAVERALRLVELTAFRHSYPRELSGGMQQRVAVARAYVRRPRVMLLDEPFSALDEMRRERFNEQFSKIQRTLRQTCVLVTHSVEEAVFMADRVAICTPRPARIAAVIDIRLPSVRDRSVRVSEEYFNHISAVRGNLRVQDDL